MKEWETSSALRYGRGITKQEVDVDAGIETVMPPPLPRKSVGSPVSSRVTAQKSQSPRARRVELQQQAVFLAVLVLSPSVP